MKVMLQKLLSVKSLVTLVMTGALVYMLISGRQPAAELQASGQWERDTSLEYRLEIKVTDVAGHPVEGTILYAANDLDLDNYQDLWGRPFSLDGEDRYRYNESMSIISGSQSYAVTPYYDHANGDELNTGWIPVNPTRATGMDSRYFENIVAEWSARLKSFENGQDERSATYFSEENTKFEHSARHF